MELNIALVLGFLIWCGISTTLVILSELRVRKLNKDFTSYRSSYQRAQDGWLEHNHTWRDRHHKLVQLIGEVATRGGYEPEHDPDWSKVSWKIPIMKAQANDVQ